VRVLVATDIAARGIHVDDIELVVHVDPPAEHKAYLHRSGRTARAGATGIVVTVATGEQMREVRALTKKAAIVARTISVSPGAAAITELTGPPADFVAPSRDLRPAESARSDRSGRPRRGGANRSVSTPNSSRTSSTRTSPTRTSSTRRSDFSAAAGRGSSSRSRRGRQAGRQRSA